MKKILTFVFLIIFIINSFIIVEAKKIEKKVKELSHPLTPSLKSKGRGKVVNNKKCFIITSYYSPLPNQRYYATWSYFRDIILNGRGHRWASWKKVFSGMLAAPSNYAFWTKIYLNWLWVAEVSDRWWAIVRAWVRGHACDRIDIWVGWWETWLKRALYWGKRKVYGNFMSRKSKVTLNINNFAAPNYALKSAYRVYSNPVFSKWIWTKNPKPDVIALQKYLKKKCLYKWKIDGNYYNILFIILDIQKKHKLIKTWNELYAGYWSYNTRQLFLKWKVKNGDCRKVTQKLSHPPAPSLKFKGRGVAAKKKKEIKKEIKNIYPLEKTFEKACGKNTDKEIVKNYQKVLKEIWLYKGKLDWNYNNIISIVAQFQIKEKLIKDKTNPATGFIWPGTRKKLKEKYKKIIDEQIEKKKKIEEEKRKKQLEEKKKKEEKERIKQEKNNEITELVESMAKLEKEASGENVKILQKTLKHFWFFDYNETGYFWDKTKDALIKYQISRKIIKDKNDVWAGYVWPKTRENLKKDFLSDKALLWKIKGNKAYAVGKIMKKI